MHEGFSHISAAGLDDRRPVTTIKKCEDGRTHENRLKTRLRVEGIQISRARSEFLFEEDQPANEIYLLSEGAVGIAASCGDCAPHVLSIVAPRSLIVPAVRDDGTARYSAKCLCDCTFWALSRHAAHRMAIAEPAIMRALGDNLGQTIDRAHNQLLNLLCRHGPARVASLLCQLDEDFRRFDDDGETANRDAEWAEISQVDLAAALGITPVYLNQILKKMKQDGILNLKSGKIKSVSITALKRISGEQ